MNLNQLCKTSPKKLNLHSNYLKNYCLISNLSFLSKLTECVIVDRLLSKLSIHNLMSKFQFAYRRFHSRETALLRV